MNCRFERDPRIGQILDLLKRPITINACDSDPGATVTGQPLIAIGQALEKIGQESCSKGMAIPEWWQVRVGADRPQFVIQFAKIETAGSIGSSRWSLTIPHYRHPAGYKPNIPEFTRGQFFGVYSCRDNSKLVVHCKTKAEVNRVLIPLIACINTLQRPDTPIIHYGERTGQQLTIATVKPTIGHFYSTGQKNLKPDWSIDFREQE